LQAVTQGSEYLFRKVRVMELMDECIGPCVLTVFIYVGNISFDKETWTLKWNVCGMMGGFMICFLLF